VAAGDLARPWTRRLGLLATQPGGFSSTGTLHLSFDGFGAAEAASDAFLDNAGSNRVSETLGYQRNGTDWATRRGEPALIQRWRITREQWLPRRRDDIAVSGAEACRQSLQATS
jgi:hypothetical protein